MVLAVVVAEQKSNKSLTNFIMTIPMLLLILVVTDVSAILEGLKVFQAPYQGKSVELVAEVSISQVDVEFNDHKKAVLETHEKSGVFESVVSEDGQYRASYPALGMVEDTFVSTYDGKESHLYLLKQGIVKEHHIAASGEGYVSSPLYKIIFAMGIEVPGKDNGDNLIDRVKLLTTTAKTVTHPTLGESLMVSTRVTEARSHKDVNLYFGLENEFAYWKGEEIITTSPSQHSKKEWPNGVNEVSEKKTEIQYQKIDGKIVPKSWTTMDFRYMRDNNGKPLTKVRLQRRLDGTVQKFSVLERFPSEILRLPVPPSAKINDKRIAVQSNELQSPTESKIASKLWMTVGASVLVVLSIIALIWFKKGKA
jgi:hypothetical protein